MEGCLEGTCEPNLNELMFAGSLKTQNYVPVQRATVSNLSDQTLDLFGTDF